ncbi:MAG: quinolinate synthase NadA [Bacteroidales bacterium]|jgi:quinolinate synthase|nr:quinolinate synthase NadA [Bacteroidales bacterium]MDD4671964.1 quinolinate synthase NadA [Bacteroidales bacterium]MDY0347214.1 quinolinate synthase NadA [Tenuifilaceae bacterium]
MSVNNSSLNLEKGFIDLPIDSNINLVQEINKLKKEKNAVILAHYYQNSEVQDIADYIGDSLGLSQKAADTDADIILYAGVNFMAETAKMLSPNKKVLIPDLNAGCSLADSCPPDEFSAFKKAHPNHIVVTYVNTTAKIKALSDVCCTSTNAVQIVESFSKDTPLIFAPDKNLGNYIKRVTNRNKMVIWDGACHVHEDFSLERILELKKQHPNARVIAHPECRKPVQLVSDFVGSTSALLNYVIKNECNEFIVATEWGILHQMQQACPNKTFIPAPPTDSTCGCNECNFMKLITLQKIYLTLKYELPEVTLEENLRQQAVKPIQRMLDISKKVGLI